MDGRSGYLGKGGMAHTYAAYRVSESTGRGNIEEEVKEGKGSEQVREER